MRRTTKLFVAISIVLTLVAFHIQCHNIMGRVPSIKIPPASFEVISLTFTLSDGEVVEIKARVRNSGGFGGVYNVKLSVDGDEIATKAISVASGRTETLNFRCSISKDDGYTIELDRFIIPIDQLAALTFNDSQTLVIGGDSIFADIWQPQQIISLTPFKPSEKDSKIITHNHVWLFDGIRWEWELNITESLHNYYKELKRPSTHNYSSCITNTADDIYLNNLVSELNKAASENGFNTFETIQFVAAFVQSLPYTSDIETTGHKDYVRYPVETLADFGGDCEDTAILLAALLDRMGQDVILVYYPNHYGIGVLGDKETYGMYWEYNDKEYFYLETSIGGWKIGEIPEHLINIPAVIYTLN